MTLTVDFKKRALMKPQLVVERVYSSDSVVAAHKSQLKSDHPIALIQRSKRSNQTTLSDHQRWASYFHKVTPVD
jgi:hypothetical protein